MSERDNQGIQGAGSKGGTLPAYEAPKVRIMTEEEVLSSFQITLANTMISSNWWVQ
jgi:hypothetical protein